MRQLFVVVAFAAFCFGAVPAYAQIRSEISIDTKGHVATKNLKITSIPEPGKSKFFYARATWEDVFIRVTVITDESTKILKQYGEKASVFDLKEGDIVNVEGAIPTSSESLNIKAEKIVDLSLLKETKEVKGNVVSVSQESDSFVLKTVKGNTITIETDIDTPIRKGARIIKVGDLEKGDTILSAKGIFDYGSYTMSAAAITVFQDKSVFKPRNFEGVLKNISGRELPTTLLVAVNGKDYTVYLGSKAEILNKNRKPIGLIRFVAGDIVRFYGAVRESDLSAVDAEVLRDMNI